MISYEQEMSNLDEERKVLRTLLDHHDAHWRAIADYLGGISLGGVDGPVDDHHGNAALVIAAIKRLGMESATEEYALIMDVENYQAMVDKLREDNKLMKSIIKAGMVESDTPPGEHWHMAACLAGLVKERDDAINGPPNLLRNDPPGDSATWSRLCQECFGHKDRTD